MRAARAAECEPEAAGEETRHHRRYIQRRLSFARVTSTTAAIPFLAGLPIPVESVRTDVIPAVITVDGVAIWRAVCFKIPERQSFKAPERQSSEAPKRQSSRASECDTLFFHKFFSRWWIRTSCLVVYRFHQMTAAVDCTSLVLFLFFLFFFFFQILLKMKICRGWAMFSSSCRCFAPIHCRSGFGPFADPCVVFAEGSEGTLPTASTCAIQLRVPCHSRCSFIFGIFGGQRFYRN